MSSDEYTYTITMELEYDELLFLYKTMSKALDSWEGGESWQQEFLEEVKMALLKTTLESQFEG